MGGCLSSASSITTKKIRLVHLSGYVEEFDQPISVNQVINEKSSSQHFVCTSLQLLSCCSIPLKGETLLQPGNLYFMLPYSVLQADVSPVDLASIAKRLTSIGKTRRCEDKKKSMKASRLSHIWDSPSYKNLGRVDVDQKFGMANDEGGSVGSVRSPWRPLLDTIRERSLNRRSESDLQEKSFRILHEMTLDECNTIKKIFY